MALLGRRQGFYWLLTVPHAMFTPYPISQATWIRGQLELGTGETGYLHWQIFVAFTVKKSLPGVKQIFGDGIHAELSLSQAASEYVWKEETRVEGSQFEFGQRKFKRNCPADWDTVWENAIAGKLLSIESDVRIRYYRTLRAISADYSRPVGMERTVYAFWGDTGTGKSRRAWSEAGAEAYPKDPASKFWCGYNGQESVIVDEFRGRIGIDHMLRWLDRYPVNVEIKGASVPLVASRIWITSNLAPTQWFPDADKATVDALLRRMTVINFKIL